MSDLETDPSGATEATGGVSSGATARTRRSTLGAIAVVVVVAVLAGLIFSTRGPATNVGGVPTEAVTPTATLSLGDVEVSFTQSAPWGKLTIDGKQMQASAVATLTQGQHAVVYEAAPFPTVKCAISVPAAASDSCPPGAKAPTDPFPGRVVDLGATLDRISTADFDALVAATQQVLDGASSTAEVVAGDHYVDANNQVAVSTQAISVTLSFAIPKQYVIYARLRCAPFCVGQGPQMVPGIGLHFIVFPTLQWQFTPAGGAPWTVSEKPITGNPIDMLVTWNGAWRVTIALDAMVGSTIEETALAKLPPTNPPNQGTGTGGGVNETPLAEGSALPIVVGSGPNCLALYHFGVLVAANSVTRQSFPTMTVASAHEATLAAQLIAHG